MYTIQVAVTLIPEASMAMLDIYLIIVNGFYVNFSVMLNVCACMEQTKVCPERQLLNNCAVFAAS